MTRNALAALGLIAVLTATGCASTSGKADSSPPNGSNADASTPASGEASPTETSQDAKLTFGHAFTWDDGLTVKVSKPKPFKPSEYAAGTGKGQAIKFTYTVVNKTNKPYDPSLFYATLQSGNAEAEEIFDTGLEGTPDTKVLAGREVKFDAGYSVKNPKDLVLEVSPDAGIEYESAIFTS